MLIFISISPIKPPFYANFYLHQSNKTPILCTHRILRNFCVNLTRNLWEHACDLTSYDAVYSDRTMPTFRRNLLPHSSALAMAAVSYVEGSIQFYHTTQCPNQKTLLFIVVAVRASKLTKRLVMYHTVWCSEIATTFALNACR
jgi:hypothetical protein